MTTTDNIQIFDNCFWNTLYDLHRGNILFPNYFLWLVLKIILPPLGFHKRKKGVRGPDVLVSKRKKCLRLRCRDSRMTDLGNGKDLETQLEVKARSKFSGNEKVECRRMKVCLYFFKVTFTNCLCARISCA